MSTPMASIKVSRADTYLGITQTKIDFYVRTFLTNYSATEIALVALCP